jgi:hypothetical protein
MRKLFQISAATAALLLVGSVSAFAACNGDTGTETVLGAASGAAVGGIASHSIAGAAIGGVAGGVIGHVIGQSNNREDCQHDAQYYGRQPQEYYQGQQDGRGGYSQQSYSQQEYAQQLRDYQRQRQDYEQQRQAYYNRYSNAPGYSTDRYGRQYYNNAYGNQTYSRYPDSRSSRYSDYSDGN